MANYRRGRVNEEMAKELQDCAELSAQLDTRMDSLREHVESQNTYEVE